MYPGSSGSYIGRPSGSGQASNANNQIVLSPNQGSLSASTASDRFPDNGRINAPAGVEFVPFSIEVSGVWGPAARGFFRESIAMAHSARDIDLYHWSNQRLSDSWKSTFSVTIAVAVGTRRTGTGASWNGGGDPGLGPTHQPHARQ